MAKKAKSKKPKSIIRRGDLSPKQVKKSMRGSVKQMKKEAGVKGGDEG